jgi:translation elongation factor EF-4
MVGIVTPNKHEQIISNHHIRLKAKSACASRKPRQRLSGIGKVDIPQEAFIAALKVDVYPPMTATP